MSYLPLSIVGSISRPGSLVFLIFLERIFLKARINVAKIMAVALCICGIICTIQPWTDTKRDKQVFINTDNATTYLLLNENIIENSTTFKPSIPFIYDMDKTENDFQGNKMRDEPVKGYIAVSLNVLLTVSILLFQRSKLTEIKVKLFYFGLGLLVFHYQAWSCIYLNITTLMWIGIQEAFYLWLGMCSLLDYSMCLLLQLTI